MELVMVDGDWRAAERIALAAQTDQPPAVAMDVLANWHATLPESERGRPVWRLVQALLSYETSLRSARQQLEALDADIAARVAVAAGDHSLRVTVLFHLATVGRRMADEPLLTEVAARLGPLAAAGDQRALAV